MPHQSSLVSKALQWALGFGAAETTAVAALVRVSALLASSVKLTFTLIVVPWSAATSVWVLAVAPEMFVSVHAVQRSGSTGTCS